MDNDTQREIQTLMTEFLQAARDGAIAKKGTEKLKEMLGEYPRIQIGGPWLGLSDDAGSQERELVDRCIRFLGVEHGSEEEIEELAWAHVWTSFSDDESFSDISENARLFVEEINSYSRQNHGYMAPNCVLRFTGKAERVVIGPVEAMKTECLKVDPGQSRDGPSIRERIFGVEPSKLAFRAGAKFDIEWSTGEIVIELPECCWVIPTGFVEAAERNAEEVAVWMINQALCLLRLANPPNRSRFPRTGDVEDMPIVEPKEFWPGGRREEKGLVLKPVNKPKKPWERPIVGVSTGVRSSVRRAGCFYGIDEVVVELTKAEPFPRLAQTIFNPPRKSLAERFSQGLGWQSRARQTADRAERLLFFFTAIESLLSGDDRQAPVVQTISRNAATILHADPAERARCAAMLRSLYGVRSRLVHAGKRNVTQSNSMAIQDITEKLYRTVMDNYPLEKPFVDFQASLGQSSYGSCWP